MRVAIGVDSFNTFCYLLGLGFECGRDRSTRLLEPWLVRNVHGCSATNSVLKQEAVPHGRCWRPAAGTAKPRPASSSGSDC